jgi:hypothetical protein
MTFTLRRTIDISIYLSVAVGVLLLIQLFPLVPAWLFYSVFLGWIAYLLVATAVAKGYYKTYPVAFILAILTLAVSLPQPEHQSFVAAGISLASITFIVGSVLQIALLILIPLYLWRRRKVRE